MSGNVVGLHGDYHPATVQTNTTVIAELERLLEAARSGEIVGVAGSYVHRNGVVGYSYAGAVAGYALIGGLECAKESLIRMALAQR
jgi:hypothetical protein